MLTLRFFGPPQAWDEQGNSLSLPRKSLALLALLMLERRPLSRAWLADMIWPNSDSAHARGALRHLLMQLRVMLGPSANALTITPQEVALQAAQVTCDVRVFEDGLSSAMTLEAERERAWAVFTRYSGPFMAEIAFPDNLELDAWLLRQRAYWEEQAHRHGQDLVDAWLEHGQAQRAAQVAMHWMNACPTDEAAYRAALRCHLALDERTRAYDVWMRAQQMLAQMEREPDLETCALVARLSREAERPVPVTDWQMPFVGRSQPFTTLQAAWRRAAQGHATPMLVSGEAGVGKTRLLREFARWAEAQGADLLWGNAFDVGGRLPFQPLIDALRPRLAAENAPEDLLSDVWLTELSRILPDLRDRYPDLPPPTDDPLAQGRLGEAVAQTGIALAMRRPILVVLEDMQWADIATRDLVLFLVHRWHQECLGILVVCSVRQEELPFDPALRRWSEQFLALSADPVLTLTGLAATTTHELVAHLVPTGNTLPLADWLFHASMGNPLHMKEALRTLIDRGVIQVRPDGTLHVDSAGPVQAYHEMVSDSLRTIILARLERLGETVSQALMAAAILGTTITVAQVATLTDQSLMDALNALETASRHMLLRATEEGYAFVDATVREVIMATTSAARRQVYHARALALLVSQGAPPERLTYHAIGARDHAMVVQQGIRAGDAALAVFAAEDARAYYERALQALAHVPTTDFATREHLHLHLARAYEGARQWAAAQETYTTWLELTRARGDVAREITAHIYLANLLLQQNAVQRSVGLLNDALHRAVTANLRDAQGECLGHLAQIHAHYLEIPVALNYARQAIIIGEEQGNDELVAGMWLTLAIAHHTAGQFAEAVLATAQGSALYACLGERAGTDGGVPRSFHSFQAPTTRAAYLALQSQCLAVAMTSQVNLGDHAAAFAMSDLALRLARESRNDWAVALAVTNYAHTLIARGEYTKALQVTQAALATTRALSGQNYLPFLLAVLGRIHVALGQWPQAQEALGEGLAIAQEHFPRWTSILWSPLCAVAAAQGRWEMALRYARESVATRHQFPGLISQDFVRWHETDALIHGGESRLAQDDLARFAALVGENRRHRLVLERMRAVMAGHAGDIQRAIDHLHVARQLATTLALPGEQWLIDAAQASLFTAAGQPGAASEAREAARDTVARLCLSLTDITARKALRSYASMVLQTDQ